MDAWAVSRVPLARKSYDVVSYAAQDPDASVFICSGSESKVVGKISRRISLLHYPDPRELQKQKSENLRQMYEKSSGTSLTNSSRHFATPTQSIRPRRTSSVSGNPASTHSSRPKSSLSELGESSKSQRRKQSEGPTRSVDQSTQDSERSHGRVTTSGSVGHSAERKSKKRRKTEG
ncbi:hypothetical protein LguiA_024625 [Lonicera macranthoides]